MSRANARVQQGQAMVEMVVMTSGCLLLLFVLVPVIAKLCDMSYKAQEAARYTAWERTVWYSNSNQDNTLPNQIDLLDGYLARRSDEDLLNSAQRRIMSFQREPLELSAQDIDPASSAQGNNYWRWTHGSGGRAMTSSGAMAAQTQLSRQDTPSFAYDVIGVYNDVMGTVNKVLDVISFGQGDDDFLQIAHPTHNFYSAAVSIPVAMSNGQLGNQSLLPTALPQLNIRARSAVLADGWVAQSAGHFDEKANDFVLGNVIDQNPIFQTVQSLVGLIEPSFKNLDLGYVNTDPIPAAEPVCDTINGFCTFDE